MDTGSVTAAFSTPVIKGTFSVLSVAEDLTNLNNIVDVITSEFIKNLRVKAAKELSTVNEWKDLAPYLKVYIENNDLVIEVDHPYAAVLEYGTPDKPMNPKLREMTKRYIEEFSQHVTKELEKVFK